MGSFTGRFGQRGSPGFEVIDRQGTLVLRFPGAPEEFDGRLEAEPAGGDRFRVRGGPLDRLAVELVRDADGEPRQLSLGRIGTFPVHPDADAPCFQIAPELEAGADRSAFDELYERCVRDGDGGVVDYRLDAPRHAFLRYLCESHGLLLHGSNDRAIDVFEPRGRTLGPTLQRSQLAVAACADAIWAIAYAVLQRSRIRGSFHNGVVPLEGAARSLRLYHFSVHAGHLSADSRALGPGAVYVLSPATFESVVDGPLGARSLEFTSPVAVRPLARLEVGPADFPLEFRGHDDSRVLRALEFIERMYRECVQAEPHATGYALHFTQRSGIEDDLKRMVGVLRAFFPWADIEWSAEGSTRAVLRASGSEGLRERIRESLQRARSGARSE